MVMTQYISTHFTMDEVTNSQTAARKGIDNDPPHALLDNIKLAAYGMELVRRELGDKPILVSSWYRSPTLNRAVGGASQSDHMYGCAVDFTCPAFGTVDEVVRRLIESAIDFKKVIREYGRWVHISFAPEGARRIALIIDSTGTREFS